MKRLSYLVSKYWSSAAVTLGIISLSLIFYCYGASRFLPGLSTAEVQTIHQSGSIAEIVKNPLWIHYKILLFIAQSVGMSGTSLRYVSGVMAICIIATFYAICRKFYSQRVSVLTTLLFGISSTTLTLSRVATPAILLYSLVSLISSIAWLRESRRTRFAPFIIFPIVALALYTPGAIWFIGLLTLWFWKDIPLIYKHLKRQWIVLGVFCSLIMMLPLIYASVQNIAVLRTWFLLPEHFSIASFFVELKNVPSAFLYKSTPDPFYNLGRLPLLDAFSGTMLLLGFYSYRTKVRLQRTIIYIFSALIGVFLACINANQLYLVICLPFIYLFMAEGLHFLLGEWRSVFPRNPIARFVGTVFMSIAVLGTCSYHMNRYFLAWINTPETKRAYSQKIH